MRRHGSWLLLGLDSEFTVIFLSRFDDLASIFLARDIVLGGECTENVSYDRQFSALYDPQARVGCNRMITGSGNIKPLGMRVTSIKESQETRKVGRVVVPCPALQRDSLSLCLSPSWPLEGYRGFEFISVG
jgi:hypothetical protein